MIQKHYVPSARGPNWPFRCLDVIVLTPMLPGGCFLQQGLGGSERAGSDEGFERVLWEVILDTLKEYYGRWQYLQNAWLSAKVSPTSFFADKSLYSLLKFKIMIISADHLFRPRAAKMREQKKRWLTHCQRWEISQLRSPPVKFSPSFFLIFVCPIVHISSIGFDMSIGQHLYLKIEKYANTFKMSRFTIVYNPLLALTFVVVYWSIGLHHTYSLWTR